MVTEDMAKKSIENGLSGVCAWCDHHYHGQQEIICGQEECRGPLSNIHIHKIGRKAFPCYSGPLSNFEDICFLCGKEADAATVKVDGVKFGVCSNINMRPVIDGSCKNRCIDMAERWIGKAGYKLVYKKEIDFSMHTKHAEERGIYDVVITNEAIDFAITQGRLNQVCARCRYWHNRNKIGSMGNTWCGKGGCGTPLTGRGARKYSGSMDSFDIFCFVCGSEDIMSHITTDDSVFAMCRTCCEIVSKKALGNCSLYNPCKIEYTGYEL